MVLTFTTRRPNAETASSMLDQARMAYLSLSFSRYGDPTQDYAAWTRRFCWWLRTLLSMEPGKSYRKSEGDLAEQTRNSCTSIQNEEVVVATTPTKGPVGILQLRHCRRQVFHAKDVSVYVTMPDCDLAVVRDHELVSRNRDVLGVHIGLCLSVEDVMILLNIFLLKFVVEIWRGVKLFFRYIPFDRCYEWHLATLIRVTEYDTWRALARTLMGSGTRTVLFNFAS